MTARYQGRRFTASLSRRYFAPYWSLSQNLTCLADVRTLGIAYLALSACGWTVDLSYRLRTFPAVTVADRGVW